MKAAENLLKLAQEVVKDHGDFFETKGPGRGDLATAKFMKDLRARALALFGTDYAEKKISGSNAFCVDYYFPDEATIIEVALGLPKARTEFERDVLKAVMAQESGHSVKRLFFISKPGAKKKCTQPGRAAIADWAKRKHGITVEVHELVGDAA